MQMMQSVIEYQYTHYLRQLLTQQSNDLNQL